LVEAVGEFGESTILLKTAKIFWMLWACLSATSELKRKKFVLFVRLGKVRLG
jgi:hypothetical protein